MNLFYNYCNSFCSSLLKSLNSTLKVSIQKQNGAELTLKSPTLPLPPPTLNFSKNINLRIQNTKAIAQIKSSFVKYKNNWRCCLNSLSLLLFIFVKYRISSFHFSRFQDSWQLESDLSIWGWLYSILIFRTGSWGQWVSLASWTCHKIS